MSVANRTGLPALMVALAAVLFTSNASAIEADADRILREMGDYLKTATAFSFHAEIAYDSVHATGEKVQYEAATSVAVRRPNRLRVDVEGDEFRRQVFYDGTTVTLFDMLKNLYAVPAYTTVVYVNQAPYYYAGGTNYTAASKLAPEPEVPDDAKLGESEENLPMTEDDHNYLVVEP